MNQLKSSTDAWWARAEGFVRSLEMPRLGIFPSVPGGPPSLYGTCYGLLSRLYLGGANQPSESTRAFVLDTQDPDTGFFLGPDLQRHRPPPGARHTLAYTQLHLTCTVLPVCRQLGWQPRYPLRFAQRFLEPDSFRGWLAERDMRDAWLEGNNLLFAGQILVHLREVEGSEAARHALGIWFDYLEKRVDPGTGLWGLREGSSLAEAIYGGYHQLLVYYHEDQPIRWPERLVDSALSLQHPDGGFALDGGGGACEDVDAVDILVNLYKRLDYRRPDIRRALRRCLRHILRLQNPDGGFPYSAHLRNGPFTHMGMETTRTTRGASALFPTWFRIHTLALIREILTDDSALQQAPLRFSDYLSMGWHRPWNRSDHALDAGALEAEQAGNARHRLWLLGAWIRHALRRMRRRAGSLWRRIHTASAPQS